LTYRLDLHEDPETNKVTATFELPGLKKEDVNIDVHYDRLTVSGESNVTNESHEKGYTVRERRFGRFTRAIPLPKGTKVSILSLN
jgi:HSP20 family protein